MSLENSAHKNGEESDIGSFEALSENLDIPEYLWVWVNAGVEIEFSKAKADFESKMHELADLLMPIEASDVTQITMEVAMPKIASLLEEEWMILQSYAKGKEAPDDVEGFKRILNRKISRVVNKALNAEYERRLSLVSDVTGLPKKAWGDERLEKLVKAKEKFAVTFFDLDKFKALNSAIGHDVADVVLRKLGERMKSVQIRKHAYEERPVGQQDSLIHRSGDEFLFVFYGADLLKAMKIAKERLAVIADEPIMVEFSADNVKDMMAKRKILVQESESRDLIAAEEDALDLINEILSQLNEAPGVANITVLASMGCAAYDPEMFDDLDSKRAVDKVLGRANTAVNSLKFGARNDVVGWNEEIGRVERLIQKDGQDVLVAV